MTTEQNPIITSLEARLAEIAHLDANAEIVTPCWKCDGRGYGGWPVDSGRCWNCNATGGILRVVRNVRSGLKREITMERKSIAAAAKWEAERETREAAHAEKLTQFIAAHEDLVKGLDTHSDDNDFLRSISEKLYRDATLSDNQIAAAEKTLAQIAEREQQHASAEPVPTGRVQITGQIISMKTVETQYGYGYKMLVLDDRGFKVFGTEPSSISPQKGDRVTFTAKCEPSNDDPKFGFYSRPTKAEILEEQS